MTELTSIPQKQRYLIKPIQRNFSIQVVKPQQVQTKTAVAGNYKNPVKFPKMKYAKETCVKFGVWRQFNNKKLYKLLHFLFRSPPMATNLSFDFTNCVKINSKGFTYMEKELTKIKRIKNLEIIFHGHYGIFDGSLRSLAKMLVRLKNLKSLSLDFSHCYSITDFGLSKILNCLSRLIHLDSISLNLEDCQCISDTSLFQLDKSLQKLDKIILFKLNLSKIIPDFAGRQEITNKGFHKLARRLGSFSGLRELALEFDNCHLIDSDDICDLSGYLADLPSIRKIRLDFAGCPEISDNHLKSLWDDLSKMKYLQSLYLNFRECNISGDGLSNLKRVFSALESLKDITLDLGNMPYNDEIHVQNLINSFEACSSTKKLNLLFDFCIQLSDKTLKFLSSKLSSLSNLTHLTLSFHGCHRITNEGFVYLFLTLWALPCLQSLSLDFRFCQLLDDSALDQLQNKLSDSNHEIDTQISIAVNNTNIRLSTFQDFKMIFGKFWKNL